MHLREIETLDNDAMNGRVAGLVSRYWHRQGYTVEVGTKEGPVCRIKLAVYRPYKKAGKADCMLIRRMRIAIRRWNRRVFVVPTAGASRDEKRVLVRQKRPSPATKTAGGMVKCGPSWPKISP